MFHLRLCKGLSYMGIVRATKAEPDIYVPEEEKAKALVNEYLDIVGLTKYRKRQKLLLRPAISRW